MKLSSARRPAVIGTATLAVLALAFTGTSVAKDLINSSDIQDNSIRSADIRNNTLKGEDIADFAVGASEIRSNAVGSSEITNGAVGSSEIANGSVGLGDLSSSAVRGIQDGTFVGEHWGVILRNTQAAGFAALRSGPFVGNTVRPPLGSGSLQLQTAEGPRDKIAFGNEVDFAGKTLNSLGGNISFSVFATGEDLTGTGGSVNNLPNITFEVDPNPGGAAPHYSSLVFVPKGTPLDGSTAPDANKWRSFNAAESSTSNGGWYFTNGATADSTGCKAGSLCTWSEVVSAKGGATILSVAIGKGADMEFQGAVDALRIGNTVYDFEARGVFARNA